MLRITVQPAEFYNEGTRKFVALEGLDLVLEHSLVSVSKWESKHEIPFLGTTAKTEEQVLDYINMMVLGNDHPENIAERFSDDNVKEVGAYIDAKMTATWFNEGRQKGGNREVITAEIIYYWMISLGIPFECQEWHLERLLTLIKVCSYKNAPKQKMSAKEAAAQQRALNAQRRAQFRTSG